MNKILLVGRLVRDPEPGTTPSNIKFCRFTLAIDRPFSERATDFIPVVAWRNDAEFVERYMRKGAQVSVEGRLQSSTYQNSAGQNVTRYEVVAEAVRGLESKAQQESRTSAPSASYSNTSVGPAPASAKTKTLEFEEATAATNTKDVNDNSDVPWEIDL